jgi:pyruvate,water dikinase
MITDLARTTGVVTPDASRVGDAASRGAAAGRVHVVGGLSDAAGAAPGSVLVFRTLPPGWVPALRAPAAVVVREGGALSNAATVLRERGIPAVVGVGPAADALREGDRVEVDATRGTVRPCRARGSRREHRAAS